MRKGEKGMKEERGSELKVCKYYNGVLINKVCKKGRIYEEMYNDNGVDDCEVLPCEERVWERRARGWCKNRELVSMEEKIEIEKRDKEDMKTKQEHLASIVKEVEDWAYGKGEETIENAAISELRALVLDNLLEKEREALNFLAQHITPVAVTLSRRIEGRVLGLYERQAVEISVLASLLRGSVYRLDWKDL